MHEDKAVSLAILMADAFSRPTADCIDDVDKAVEGIKKQIGLRQRDMVQ